MPRALQVVITEGGDAKDGRGGHEKDQVDADREANVVDAAMGALGAVARALPWHHYDTLLGQFMRAMKVGARMHVCLRVPALLCVCVFLVEVRAPGRVRACEGDRARMCLWVCLWVMYGWRDLGRARDRTHVLRCVWVCVYNMHTVCMHPYGRGLWVL